MTKKRKQIFAFMMAAVLILGSYQYAEAEANPAENGEINSTLENAVLPQVKEPIDVKSSVTADRDFFRFEGGTIQGLTEEGKQKLVSVKGLVIPEAINGVPVKVIASAALENCGIEGKLILPKNLETIESYAFKNNKITEVVFGYEKQEIVDGQSKTVIDSELTSIGVEAFIFNNLTGEVKIPKSVKSIGELAFSGKTQVGSEENEISKLTFEEGSELTEIGNYAFEWNKIAGNLVLPKKLKSVPLGAFKENLLTGVEFGPELTSIGVEAFIFNNLTGEVKIPKSVKSIGELAFSGKTKEGSAQNDISGLSFEEGSELTEIGNYAFEWNKIPGKLVLPKKLKVLPLGVFKENLLTEVEFGPEVTTIGQEAFYNNKITDITEPLAFPSTLTSIGKEAFLYNNLTGEIKIPKSVKSIGELAFSGKTQAGSEENEISKLTFEEGSELTEIGNYAFEFNKIPGKLVLPKKLKVLPLGVFKENLLTEVEFGPEVTTIGQEAFYNNKITDTTEPLAFPSTLTSIGKEAFLYNNLTGEIKIPKSVKSIGELAFSGKTQIGSAQNDISGLTFEEGSELTEIGNYAFEFNKIPGKLVLPKKLKVLPLGVFKENLLTEVEFGPEVTTIGQHAFYFNHIKNLSFPETLESIGEEAFLYNELSGVLKFPKSLKSIGRVAFSGKGKEDNKPFNQITGVELPEGSMLQELHEYAFEYNKIKGRIYLPESLTKIGKHIFYDNHLASIEVRNNQMLSERMFGKNLRWHPYGELKWGAKEKMAFYVKDSEGNYLGRNDITLPQSEDYEVNPVLVSFKLMSEKLNQVMVMKGTDNLEFTKDQDKNDFHFKVKDSFTFRIPAPKKGEKEKYITLNGVELKGVTDGDDLVYTVVLDGKAIKEVVFKSGTYLKRNYLSETYEIKDYDSIFLAAEIEIYEDRPYAPEIAGGGDNNDGGDNNGGNNGNGSDANSSDGSGNSSDVGSSSIPELPEIVSVVPENNATPEPEIAVPEVVDVTEEEIPLAPEIEEFVLTDENGDRIPLGDTDLEVLEDENPKGSTDVKDGEFKKVKSKVQALLATTGGLNNVFFLSILSLTGLVLLFGIVERLRRKVRK